MRGFTLTRDDYVKINLPAGAIKVCDKLSDAVAYLYDAPIKPGVERPAYAVFYGKQGKPVARFYTMSLAKREEAVAKLFAARRQHALGVVERRQTPSDTATRNAAIKRALEAKYGKGKVRVTGDRGTAYGWVRVKFSFPRPCPPGATGDAKQEVVKIIEAAGVKLGYYDSADYGSGYELAVDWERE